ncbi:SAC3/GANP/Nin1/mts3/eIF-3 p25 family-domain-containing protein [Hypoxylon cercidicola]|nr:SAC3/GANP/Nin1/mts3/eIF-3 p25 family-domain-containing protein [Hypoxylon cercidicola]
MLNSERKGGWGFGQPSGPTTNPFAPTTASAPINPFAQLHDNSSLRKQPNGVAPSPNSLLANPPNPFAVPSSAKPFGAPSGPSAPSFGAPSAPSFGAPTASTNKPSAAPFGRQEKSRDKSPATVNPFAPSNNAQRSKRANSPTPNVFAKQQSPGRNTSNKPAGPTANGKGKVAEYVQPAWPKQPEQKTSQAMTGKAPRNQINGKRKNENDNQRKSKFSRTSPNPEAASIRSRPAARSTKQDATPTNNGAMVPRVAGNTGAFAESIMRQLAKDNIKPPRWPENPGSYMQRAAIEAFRGEYKKYRDRARNSLMRAGLIDDPDKRRRLDEALVFKGICEDYCPEWEKITRIVEHDIRRPEKDIDEYGELAAMPSLMVKRLARSAAGQESPLPMDVRSVATLRRTLDYLIDDLIPTDDLLSERHSFLWDRTRAIRIDFSFQKYAMTPEELKDQVYCLETIARFHVTALHLLSQDGLTPGDYSEQQEIEQLSKTLISLIEVYDDCAQQEITCENEAEFRGYYIIFNVHTPALLERISNWHGRSEDPDKIKSAICIIQVMKNIREMQGPLSPNASPGMLLQTMSVFFEAIAKPEVSYTMACFAEIHFNYVRKSILQTIRKSFSRPRYGPKDLTPAVLKQYLRTDTEEEAVEFFRKHGFQFSEDGYVMLSPSPEYVDTRVPHSFSRDIVERKRCGRSLPTVIHETVYEDVSEEPTEALLDPEEDSLFVSDSQDQDNQEGAESEGEYSEATLPSSPPTTTPRPLLGMLGNHAITMPNASTLIPSVAQSEVGSPSPSLSSVASASTEQSAMPVPVEPSADIGTKAGASSSPSPWPAPVPANVSMEQPSPMKNPFGNVSGAPPSFSFLNKSEGKGAESPSAAPGTSIFSGLSSKTSEKLEHKLPMPATSTSNPLPGVESKPSDSPNKDKPQPPVPSDTSTTPILGFGFPTSTASISHTSELLSKDGSQPSTLSSASTSLLQPTSDASQPAVTSATTPTFPVNIQPTGASATNQSTPTVSQQLTTPRPQDTLSKGASVPAENLFPPQQSGRKATPADQSAIHKKALDNFTSWFVRGDKGLMDERLLQVAVNHALEGVWDGFQAAEEERKQKEELEKAWATARKFREYNLGVKYFYRWHKGFRDRQRIKRMKVEREKARIWNLPENIARRELAAKEEQERAARQAEESMLWRSQHNVDKAINLKQSAQLESRVANIENSLSRPGSSASSLEERIQGLEDALIATGIFKGVRDERAAARHAAAWGEGDADVRVRNKSLQAEKHRRTKHGLNPLKALPELETYKDGSKTAMLRALYNGPGRDTMSMSTGSLRNSTFSSSYRSSLGYNGHRVSKHRSRIADPYWRLKALGLVRMPNGEYLHESVALPMLQEGKRIPGFGDYGLPPVQTTTPDQSPLVPRRYSSASIRHDGIRPDDANSSPSSAEGRKRKRHTADEADATPSVADSPTGRKRRKSGDGGHLTDAQTHLDDIAKLLKKVETSSRSPSSRVKPTSWTSVFKTS